LLLKKNLTSFIKPFLNDIKCLNIEDKDGNNVLFYSVVNGQFLSDEAYSEGLINSGIDVNHTNHDGETALIYSIKKGYPKSFQYLLRNPNVDIDVVDKSGKTAAMYVVERG